MMTSTQKILAALVVLAAAGGIYAIVSGGDPPKSTDAGAPAESYVKTDPPIMSAPKPNPTPSASIDTPVPGPTSVSMATAAYEAKMVTRAQQAYDKGDYKQALREIEDYEKIPDRALLTPQATMLKIQILPHVGRRTDALALAMETRSDEKFKDYHDDVENILVDAGLRQP